MPRAVIPLSQRYLKIWSLFGMEIVRLAHKQYIQGNFFYVKRFSLYFVLSRTALLKLFSQALRAYLTLPAW